MEEGENNLQGDLHGRDFLRGLTKKAGLKSDVLFQTNVSSNGGQLQKVFLIKKVKMNNIKDSRNRWKAAREVTLTSSGSWREN